MKGLLFLSLMLIAPAISALELAEAERLAIESDPQLQAIDARSRASGHLAVSEAQLPDPALQLGAQSVPLPSFDVRDEPMTQFQLGIEQRVPARSQREAAVQRQRAEQDALALHADARTLQVRAAVRAEWTEIVGLQSLIDLTLQRARLLARYSDALDDGVQNGRVSQQTLLEGRTRELRVQRTLTQLSVRLAERRAKLEAWLPGIELPDALAPIVLSEPVHIDIDSHPVVLAAGSEALVAEAGIAAARSAFDPGWSWSLGVGRRIGDVPSGAPDETLLNARLRIELPFFTGDRQSQRLAAARESHRAALSAPVDARRGLSARLDRAEQRATQFYDLARSYAEDILPRSLEAAEAARDKYRNGSIPLEDVLAAEVEVLDVRHERIEAQIEVDRARVDLAFLGGL